jgi:hypothetical protein
MSTDGIVSIDNRFILQRGANIEDIVAELHDTFLGGLLVVHPPEGEKYIDRFDKLRLRDNVDLISQVPGKQRWLFSDRRNGNKYTLFSRHAYDSLTIVDPSILKSGDTTGGDTSDNVDTASVNNILITSVIENSPEPTNDKQDTIRISESDSSDLDEDEIFSSGWSGGSSSYEYDPTKYHKEAHNATEISIIKQRGDMVFEIPPTGDGPSGYIVKE